jgi:hypothetical protein
MILMKKMNKRTVVPDQVRHSCCCHHIDVSGIEDFVDSLKEDNRKSKTRFWNKITGKPLYFIAEEPECSVSIPVNMDSKELDEYGKNLSEPFIVFFWHKQKLNVMLLGQHNLSHKLPLFRAVCMKKTYMLTLKHD